MSDRLDMPAHLSPAEVAALSAFITEARRLLGDHLQELRLFGSRARGQGGPDSDLDIALVVTPEGQALRRELLDLSFDLLLQHGVQISPLVMEQGRLERLRRRERLIAKDLDREGIVL